jgi:hypothetical protein
MGHVSGSLDTTPLARYGWTNIAPSAVVTATSEWRDYGNSFYNGNASHLIDRRNYVPTVDTSADGQYQDRTQPWIADNNQGIGQAVQLDWSLPVAVLDVRLVGAEPGQDGFSSDYRVSGELRFYLAGQEITSARQTVGRIVPLGQGGTTVHLPKPIAVDRMVFTITSIIGKHNEHTPAALSEIEVIGQGASPSALGGRPVQVILAMIRR